MYINSSCDVSLFICAGCKLKQNTHLALFYAVETGGATLVMASIGYTEILPPSGPYTCKAFVVCHYCFVHCMVIMLIFCDNFAFKYIWSCLDPMSLVC